MLRKRKAESDESLAISIVLFKVSVTAYAGNDRSINAGTRKDDRFLTSDIFIFSVDYPVEQREDVYTDGSSDKH